MASITGWTRLETTARSREMETSLQARVHDASWLLARQWQLGELRAEDAGSPVSVRWRAETSRLTRFHAGPLPKTGRAPGREYDSRALPLETLVERESVSTARGLAADRRLAAAAGLHFSRLLSLHGVGKYRASYSRHHLLELPAEGAGHDAASLRFLRLMSGRVPDGEKLRLDPSLPDGTIDEQDLEVVAQAIDEWRQWLGSLLSAPDGGVDPWIPERMEYAFSVAAATSDGEIVLGAPEYPGGHLDWYSFHVHPGASLGADREGEPPLDISRTVIPVPVSFRGMPAARWWELEDAEVDFGSVDVSSEDPAKLLLLDFALVYGNDWFLVPIELDVGSLCRARSLVVTDTFGQRTLIRPYHQVDGPGSPWRLFCPGLAPGARGDGNPLPDEVFFLPPTLHSSLHSRPFEEVLLLRDELANMAWAVEKVVAGPTGRPASRFESYQRERRSDADEQAAESAEPIPEYRLAGTVPDYWIPLLPVPGPDGGSLRLQRARMLIADGEDLAEPQVRGRLLAKAGPLAVFEEEVPRAGARITRAHQYARWLGGSTHLWRGRLKVTGTGEGWSGLRFDFTR